MALNQHTSQVEKAIVVLKFVMKAYVLPRVIIEQSDFEVDKEFLINVPNLIVISSSGAGYDTIDVDACSDAGVLVVNQTGGNAEGVAEHAVGMILSLFKRIGECDHALRRGWNEARISLMGKDLLNKTVGIIGLGNTGGRVAEICKIAFNCNILAYDPYLSDDNFHKKMQVKLNLILY